MDGLLGNLCLGSAAHDLLFSTPFACPWLALLPFPQNFKHSLKSSSPLYPFIMLWIT